MIPFHLIYISYDNIDATVCSFIWGRIYCHPVNWKNLIKPKSHRGLGICTTMNLNISLLGKHIWDILHQTQKLWVQSLRNKYLSNTHILHTLFNLVDFCIWHAIVKGVEILGSDFICIFGRGHISVWYDKWINNIYICSIVPYIDISDNVLV